MSGRPALKLLIVDLAEDRGVPPPLGPPRSLAAALVEAGVAVSLLQAGERISRLARREAAGVEIFEAQRPVRQAALVAAMLRPDAVLLTGPGIDAACAEMRDTRLPLVLWLAAGLLDAVRDAALGPSHLLLVDSAFLARRSERLLGRPAEILVPPAFGIPEPIAGTGGKVLLVDPRRGNGAETMLHLIAARPNLPFIVVESERLGADWRRDCFSRLVGAGNVDWHISPDDWPWALGHGHVLVLPSIAAEGRRGYVSDAQEAGIPVIGARIGALPESIGPGGVLLESDLANEFWTAELDRLWRDQARHAALSAAARAQARQFRAEQAEVPRRLIGLVTAHVDRCRRAGLADPPRMPG
jgi:hypothetical protein